MDFLRGEWIGFPYAIRLAEERGATQVHIQPRLQDSSINGDVRPDVYAERPGKIPLIIEVEDSVGQKLNVDGPRHRESRLVGKAEFVFIIGPGAKGGCEKRLRQWFGDQVELLYLRDLIGRYGRLGVASKALGSATLTNLASETTVP
jgi:hypothetical protein